MIVADTSVLINFLCINRMDLIGRHPDQVVVTDDVTLEIVVRQQRARFRAAVSERHLRVHRLAGDMELDLFLRLSENGSLGPGERSAIAAALTQDWRLAMDDKRATRCAHQFADRLGRSISVVGTLGLVAELVKLGLLDAQTANAMRVEWANHHRFRTPTHSSRAPLLL